MNTDELHRALAAHRDTIRAISADLRQHQAALGDEDRVWDRLEHARLSLAQAVGWLADAMAHVPEVRK